MTSFERPEGNLYELFKPSENNMVYAKSSASSETYLRPFLEADPTVSNSLNEFSPRGASIQQPTPIRPRITASGADDLSLVGQGYVPSQHGNPPELNQRAVPTQAPRIRGPPNRPHAPPLSTTGGDSGCRLCGKKILTQCACSSRETVCENGHCYFVDPRTGRTYGKTFPQAQLPQETQRQKSHTSKKDNYGNPITKIS